MTPETITLIDRELGAFQAPLQGGQYFDHPRFGEAQLQGLTLTGAELKIKMPTLAEHFEAGKTYLHLYIVSGKKRSWVEIPAAALHTLQEYRNSTDERVAKLRKARMAAERKHDSLYNDGGEGYNPYR